MFGYRIGMTMSEWACRGLMGLGPTIHAEATTPPGCGPLWSHKRSQPDLVGYHRRFPQTWLIEAKGSRELRKKQLWKGVEQLSTPGLMDAPHVRVLCGTSIEHRVFMTIDIESILRDAPGRSVPGSHRQHRTDDAEAIFALASSRMLTYYALQALPRAALAVRPVGMALGGRNQLGTGSLVFPLEDDWSTLYERERAADQESYARCHLPGAWDQGVATT